MGKKNNIRSLRFSDEMMEMIESQAGDTFTAKFEALVTRCMWELPRKEEELQNIQKSINRERERLIKLQQTMNKLEQNARTLAIAQEQIIRTIKGIQMF